MVLDQRSVSEEAVSRLQREVRALRAAVLALAALSAIGVLASFAARSEGVLRVRGLVVEDAQGKPRILIGAPVPATDERQREDPATGLVLLDANGVDRLQIGAVGGPQMGGKVQPRIADATGLMVCDTNGNERAGFGYLANGQVGWGLDYEGGEAIVAAVLPQQGLAGIVINAETDEGNPTRATLMATKDGVGLRLSDAKGGERAVLEVGGLGAPALQVLDATGALVRDVLAGDK